MVTLFSTRKYGQHAEGPQDPNCNLKIFHRTLGVSQDDLARVLDLAFLETNCDFGVPCSLLSEVNSLPRSMLTATHGNRATTKDDLRHIIKQLFVQRKGQVGDT